MLLMMFQRSSFQGGCVKKIISAPQCALCLSCQHVNQATNRMPEKCTCEANLPRIRSKKWRTRARTYKTSVDRGWRTDVCIRRDHVRVSINLRSVSNDLATNASGRIRRNTHAMLRQTQHSKARVPDNRRARNQSERIFPRWLLTSADGKASDASVTTSDISSRTGAFPDEASPTCS